MNERNCVRLHGKRKGKPGASVCSEENGPSKGLGTRRSADHPCDGRFPADGIGINPGTFNRSGVPSFWRLFGIPPGSSPFVEGRCLRRLPTPGTHRLCRSRSVPRPSRSRRSAPRAPALRVANRYGPLGLVGRDMGIGCGSAARDPSVRTSLEISFVDRLDSLVMVAEMGRVPVGIPSRQERRATLGIVGWSNPALE
jgi:hypothetical protein